MGNLDFSANADQLKELAAYMASQINVPTIGIGGGYAPIGTIISYMGTTAPQDYLACDGTVYNIADYPQLADYFESQFGESNHFGGNGTTTFAVPDLRGEFLRCTGTNSHANQGSGANVGVHQDATEIPRINIYGNNWLHLTRNPSSDSSGDNKKDSAIGNSVRFEIVTSTANSQNNGNYAYTARPTNTSVLYCIKAVVAGEVYSTEERVVGTWIDGKPIYQKTWDLGDNISFPQGGKSFDTDNTIKLIISGKFMSNGGSNYNLWCYCEWSGTGNLYINNVTSTTANVRYITLQYTKTTD